MDSHPPDHLWRNPQPRRNYQVAIIGGGGHGLATAHYLARNHGITDVTVIERGWLVGGNMARNTTIIRSNYLWDASAAIYELEPVLNCVVMSNTVHVYVSQADKGELVMRAGINTYNSYVQRGSVHIMEQQVEAALELLPIFGQAHIVRTWAGLVDVAPDASPIMGRTPIDSLWINCGWGAGGFKATPGAGWVLAATVANGEPHPLMGPFTLDRFASGALIDEHGAAAVAH